MNQKCKCSNAIKTWKGDDRKCAFLNGVFNTDNWNCSIMNELRDLCENVVWSNDQNASLLPIDGFGEYTYLFLGWYKNRGRTEQAFLISDRSTKQLALEDALKIIKNNDPKS